MPGFFTFALFYFQAKAVLKMAKITKDSVKGCLKGSALTLATLAGVIGGVVFGLCLRQSESK